ncbi:MAG: hypothetical protein HRT87_09750 [Legionellales bacterium]|nr:hypothetical protein [Legionellales bacterium]
MRIIIPKFSAFKLDSNIQLSAQNIATIQRVARYYVALNGLEVGDALVSTDFLGSEAQHLMESPDSPLPGGGYTYLTTVPEIGTCYASESSSEYGEQVNTIAENNNFCR